LGTTMRPATSMVAFMGSRVPFKWCDRNQTASHTRVLRYTLTAERRKRAIATAACAR
jgi:hypothetical protein